MNYILIIGISVIVVCLISIWLAYRFLKKRKTIAEMERDVPEEVLERFNKVEHKMKGGIKEDGTTESPYRILWEVARKNSSRRIERTEPSSSTAESTVSNGELCKQSSRRQDIQTRATTDVNKDKPIARRFKSNNIRRTLASIRRRRKG